MECLVLETFLKGLVGQVSASDAFFFGIVRSSDITDIFLVCIDVRILSYPRLYFHPDFGYSPNPDFIPILSGLGPEHDGCG